MNQPAFANRIALLYAFLLTFGFVTAAHADITLPRLFSSHAVLQKSDSTKIWGKASPEEIVLVSIGSIHGETHADKGGRWQIMLDLSKIDPGPHDLVVRGNNRLVVSDVVVGEIWLCAGQSNMQWNMRGDTKEMTWLLSSKRTNPMLRQFQVVIANSNDGPLDDCQGSWTLASPQDAPAFTGVGYFFGKKLQAELQVPIGLVHASVPGTAIENFMSMDAFEKLPALNAGRLKRLQTFTNYPGKRREYVAAYEAWTAKYDRRDKTVDSKSFTTLDDASTGWSPMRLPGKAESPGVLWLRHAVTVAGVSVGKPATLVLGGLHDFVTIYWNGTRVVETDPAHPPLAGVYKFVIPGELTREGTNILTLRLSGAADPPGLYEHGVSLSLAGQGSPVKWEGDWLAQMESTLPPISDQARRELPHPPFPPNPTVACSVYNAMIAPLTAFTLRGIIWYQGEANVPRAYEYKASFRALIEDYRRKWGAELPFYFCQLPNYLPSPNENSRGMWAELRESQSAALELPNTGQAVLIDVGEEGNLHPFNKHDPGERLARIALAKVYGKPIVYSGPMFESFTIEAGKVRVEFNHSEGGLFALPIPENYKPNTNAPLTKPLVRNSPQSQLEGFEVCGGDGKWAWADATIVGNSVVVSSPAVATPIHVRYDWSDCPWGNLYNGERLPAAPFRTDSQPGLTANNKY